MQIYMDTLTVTGVQCWEIYIDPSISIDSKGITLNGTFYKYVDIARISIDGKTKSFNEAFVWAKRDEIISEKAKELLNLKTLSVPAMTFLVENLAPKCIEPLSKDLKAIPEIDLKKYAKAMTLRLARNKKV